MADSGLKRRDFFKFAGVSGAGILSGCISKKSEKLIPYLVPPEKMIPGVERFYASTCRECPAGCGIVVRGREARAVKIEGNPRHPINKGGLCAIGQSALQDVYNPDRIKIPLLRGENGNFVEIGWDDALKILIEKIKVLKADNKTSHIAYAGSYESGSLNELITECMDFLDSNRYYVFETFDYHSINSANKLTFDKNEIPLYKFEKSDFILSFGADFLERYFSPVEYSHSFANTRCVESGKPARFVYVSPRLSLTGANSDEWFCINAGSELFFIIGMIKILLSKNSNLEIPAEDFRKLEEKFTEFSFEEIESETGVSIDRIDKLTEAFSKCSSPLAVGGGIAGLGTNAVETLAAVNILNYVTGAVGNTIQFGSGINSIKAAYRNIQKLMNGIRNSEIDLALFYNVNPVFNMPVSSNFRKIFEDIPYKVCFSNYIDETSSLADLIIPFSCSLESWGDYNPRKGVYGLIQPVMAPVNNSMSMGDILLKVIREIDNSQSRWFSGSYYEYVKEKWKTIWRQSASDLDFERFWVNSLKKGGYWLEDDKTNEKIALNKDVFSVDFKKAEFERFDDTNDGNLNLIVFPSMSLHDGRGANKPWLQELPDPVSKVVWGSWIEIHPETAKKLRISKGETVNIVSQNGKITAPVYIYRGIHKNAVAVPIGQGHRLYGRYAENRGANPIEILSCRPIALSGSLPFLTQLVKVEKSKIKQNLVSTEGGTSQGERKIIQTILVSEIFKPAHKGAEHKYPDMYEPFEYPVYHWGMAIDLNRCTGCGACVAACFAENNIAVVGEDETAKGREMQWIRIEKYINFENGKFSINYIPVLCQQCDSAPCESVCPVFATNHSREGLNLQIYNRCVGTRYCSNNCPYKVRRFNWFDNDFPKPLNRQLNPDVTVREKGVMEKCTFCVQRIRIAKDKAKDKGRTVQDGEITSACAQTCPANAIVFGNMNDKKSKIFELSKNIRAYRLLEELNTKPSVTYLKNVKQDINL